MTVRRSDLWSAWLRTFVVQGGWNYHSLVGSGVAYALLPVLRRVHAGDPVRMRGALHDHLGAFNANPYLAPLAVGALARAERDGEDRETIRRFRRALSGPLGSLGDRVVWCRWRPFCVLATLDAWLGAGMPAWGAVLLFLGMFNAGHVALRGWAFRAGWRRGLEVVTALRNWGPDRWSRVLPPLNALLLGSVGYAAARRALDAGVAPPVGAAAIWAPAAGAAAGAALAFRWPGLGRRAAPFLLASGALVGALVGG